MSSFGTFGQLRAPLTDDKGNISREWTKLFQEWFKKVGTALDDQGNLISEILASTKIQGRSEGIGTTVSKLTNVGQLTNADQVAADGSTFGRVVQTALTANQPDLSKAGVVGQAPSSKIVKNVMNNYSNNATVDSIDNGVNATIRVYGPGGPGTTWHQFIGAVIGPENAAFSGTAAYDTDFNVYLDAGNVFHITAVGSETLPDERAVLRCAAYRAGWRGRWYVGGGGGSSGGGGGNGQSRK
jgi:hypothetical protein